MAVDSYDPTTGRPIFLDTGAPDTGVDPTAAGIYAADVGNRVVRANLAGLDAYPYKRSGLAGYALDTKFNYVHDGSGWVLRQPAKAVASGTITLTNTTGGGASPIFWSDLFDVTFPAGMFTIAPQVFVQTTGIAGQVPFGGLVEQITTSGCKVRGMRVAASPGVGFFIHWVAVQG